MNEGKSAVIILAAGFSSRMQDFKPLFGNRRYQLAGKAGS